MLPPELDEEIIDFLQGQTHALLSCATVCKSWHLRCRQHLYRDVHIRTRRQLDLFQRSLSSNISLRKLVEMVVIHNPVHSSPIVNVTSPNIDIVAVLLLSALPGLNALAISSNHKKQTGTLHIGPTALRCAVSMRALDHLILHNIRFITLASLGRLLCAFPSLKTLQCTKLEVVSGRDGHFMQTVLSRNLRVSRLKVRSRAPCVRVVSRQCAV